MKIEQTATLQLEVGMTVVLPSGTQLDIIAVRGLYVTCISKNAVIPIIFRNGISVNLINGNSAASGEYCIEIDQEATFKINTAPPTEW